MSENYAWCRAVVTHLQSRVVGKAIDGTAGAIIVPARAASAPPIPYRFSVGKDIRGGSGVLFLLMFSRQL